MVAAQAPGGPSRPPANIEDFLWNIHSVLVATPGPLALDGLKDAYSKHFGHKCAIERFLVVGDGGLAATLKRIPHIVTLIADNATQCVKATNPADFNKQQLIEADSAYRRELIKKNAAAKAKAGATGAKAPAGAAPPKAGSGAPAAVPASGGVVAEATAPKAGAPPAADAGQAKRPAENAAAGGDAKKARTDSDSETLARMLVQGVVRVLQNRQKAGKGPLPIGELEEEFKALWKVPFNLQQAGETDAVTFLQKWTNKVELLKEGNTYSAQLPKKAAEKAKSSASPPPAKAGDSPAKAVAPPAPAATTVASAGSGAPATTAKAPATAAKAAPGAAAPALDARPAAPPAVAATAPKAPAAKNGPAAGPTRPPANIEDFLFNLHTALEAYGGPMPLDLLKEQYSKTLGHKCAIERFLVVGDGGLAATLKRIPHVVSVVQEKDATVLKMALPTGTTKEDLTQADLSYRKQLQQKNQAAKASASQVAATAATPAAASNVAPAKSVAAPPVAHTAPPLEGEKDPKKPRGEDVDTLARMMVQGIVRVLQNRVKEGKGPLPVNSLEDEFKALWKVPFNLQQAGETDVVTFLKKWPNRVEVAIESNQTVVSLAKKGSEKAKATTTPAAAPAKTGPPEKAASLGAAASAPPKAAGAPATATASQPAAKPPAQGGAPVAATSTPAAASASAPPAVPGKPAAAKEPAAQAAVASRQPDRGDALAAEGLQTLPQIKAEAVSVLQSMREMLKKQEAIVNALEKL